MNEIINNAALAASTPASGPPEPEPYDHNKHAAEVAARETSRVAALSPTERRLEEITKDEKYLAGDPALVAEVRRLVNADAPEPTFEQMRERFNITSPALPLEDLAYYEVNYAGHEAELLGWADREGLQAQVVRDLRDHGILMATMAAGERVSDDAIEDFRTKFSGRLSGAQLDLLVKFWRTEVEGEPS